MFPTSMRRINPTSSVSSTSCTTEEQNDLRFEVARLATFRNWPVPFSIPPEDLAAAGFFYTGIMDRVKCFVCQVEICDWPKDSVPREVHQINSPECRFVRNEHCDNVPIETCLRPRELTEPEKMKYASFECRLRSFATWPHKYMKIELAGAGFYYYGINGIAICHHCGIRLENWSPRDDPWNRHATSSPECCYILQREDCQCVHNVTDQVFAETFEEAPIETTDENHERSHSENETNEKTPVEKIAALEHENQELEDARSCIICFVREATVSFIPCRHVATCHYCSHNFNQCIICRKEVTAAFSVGFS